MRDDDVELHCKKAKKQKTKNKKEMNQRKNRSLREKTV
jgi:hypothetical protein